MDGKDFNTFLTHLMNHVANEAKTPQVKVQVSFERWKSQADECDADLEYLKEQYMKNHQVPRLEMQQRMDEFVMSKNVLYHTWKKTKNEGDLRAWLDGRFEGYIDDPVYTYRIH